MAEIDPIFVKLDNLICTSRLNQLALMMTTERSDRILKMRAALKQLRPGAYLLGTGPSTVGIIPLTVDVVVIGRYATVLEQPTEILVDYAINDTMYFVPFEVSKAHARIVRQKDADAFQYEILDLGSTCGTYVNGANITSTDEKWFLKHGDVVSLGPSQTSTYVFFQAEHV
jgi:pSer/pThr/pTyr-binding forkhead associated (FHA) protein